MMRSKKVALAVSVLGVIVSMMIFGAMSCALDLPEDYGCTALGITGGGAADDGIFFGLSFDNSWWPTRSTLFVIQPEEGYKYIGIKTGKWGFDGMNEKGFAYTAPAVSATDSPNPEGSINYLNFGPLILERCANVEEAIKFLKQIEGDLGDFWTRNLIIGDAEGYLALVEMGHSKINVDVLTKDGYIVRTNHFTSDEMKDLDKKPDDYQCDRLAKGYEWFEERLKNSQVHAEDLFDAWAYIYSSRQGDPEGGPIAACVYEPKKLIYWFTVGWPGGNLPTAELKDRQICQDMTWGVAIPFYLKELPPGQYTTELGQLTPLGVQYLYAHFSSDLQRSPAWFKYQSVDPLAPFYKPAEDVASPSGYEPKENPYGPCGRPGTWTRDEGYIPPPEEEEEG